MPSFSQAQFVARQQQVAQQKQKIIQALLSGELPAQLIMDKRLPFTDQERQSLWNQRAANYKAISSTSSGLSADEVPAYAGLVSRFGRSDGPLASANITSNQLTESLSQLQRHPDWQALDDKSQIATLQRIYGNDIASRYANQLLDQETIAKNRRKEFDDNYETNRILAKQKLLAQARLAATEPEMLREGLLKRNIVERPGGIFERNPAYNPRDILSKDIPQYIPASAATERMVASHWNEVMPGRPIPLHPEKLMRFKVAEENPGMSTEEIDRESKVRLTNLLTSQQRNLPVEDIEARRKLQSYTDKIPTTTLINAPQKPTGNTPELRFGEKLHEGLKVFGQNAARDTSRIIPRIQSQIQNLSELPFQAAGTATQFIEDLFGTGRKVNQLLPPIPVSPTETSSYAAYPDWLKDSYNSSLR